MTLSQFKVHSDSTENPALEEKWVTLTSGPAGSNTVAQLERGDRLSSSKGPKSEFVCLAPHDTV